MSVTRFPFIVGGCINGVHTRRAIYYFCLSLPYSLLDRFLYFRRIPRDCGKA